MLLILLFALIQGLTEFLPISSQGHLIFLNNFFNISEKSALSILEMNILAHMGSLLAVFIFYRKRILGWIFSIKMIVRPDLDRNIFLLINILISSIPLFFFGYFFAKYFNYSSDILIIIISLTSILFGILIFFTDKFCLRIKNIEGLTYKLSFLIGLFQCIALVPGVSRSGSVITVMRLLGFRREFAVEFTNLLAIPAISGAVCYLMMNNQDLIFLSNLSSLNGFILLIASFLFSLVFIFFFVKWVQKFSFSIFAIYRILFGLALIIYFYI